MSIDLSKYNNAIRNHGYNGYIGVYNGPDHGSLKTGHIFLVKNLKVDTTNFYTERDTMVYMNNFRTLDIPYTEEEWQTKKDTTGKTTIGSYSIEGVPKHYVKKYNPELVK